VQVELFTHLVEFVRCRVRKGDPYKAAGPHDG
jgi:hypothetical protein